MDLVEYSYFANYDSPAFLCSKLVYKSLAYIFREDTPKVVGAKYGSIRGAGPLARVNALFSIRASMAFAEARTS